MEKEKKSNLKIKSFAVGPLETNCILVADSSTKEACVVDPGDESEIILQELADEGWNAVKIVITHGHYDHIGALHKIVMETGAEVFINKKDEILIRDSVRNFSAFLGLDYKYDGKVSNISQGSKIKIGSLTLDVIEIPGHTPGSIGLAGNGFVIVGDTLFEGGIGRTDIPGGSSGQLLDSIQKQILSLPDDTVVYPGHGPKTTVGEERNGNPFIR
ncbi:MBL fold metallo-hydrolase [bacterium]|nr:MBL fold metallo-hydrolase [bacterium]